MAQVAALSEVVPLWRALWVIAFLSGLVIAAAVAVERFAGRPLNFGSRHQVLVYLIICFILPVAFALTSPAFILSVFSRDPLSLSRSFTAMLRVTLSNATALLLVAPALILWSQRGPRRVTELVGRRTLEAGIITLLLIVVGLLAFGTGPEIARLPALLLWLFPPLLWAAVRFGPTGAATGLFGVAALSIVGTAHQFGPFVHVTQSDRVLLLQMFWIVLCLPIMLLAAVIREREEVEDTLHDQRNQLARATRVATIGELSGALAHELRQPLASILANAQAAQRLLAQTPVPLNEVREILEDITHSDRDAAKVISHIRTFIKEDAMRVEPLALETLVRDALALSHTALELSGIHVLTEIPAMLPRVPGDRIQLLQVVLSLIMNSYESMSSVPPLDRELRLDVSRIGTDHVELRIADRGVGLPRGAEERVFEPFFTTKDTGLGLGLSIGRSIVTAHGGRLWAENNPRRGATFHLLLRTEHANGKPERPLH
jgi:signal transduction histidine kinase